MKSEERPICVQTFEFSVAEAHFVGRRRRRAVYRLGACAIYCSCWYVLCCQGLKAYSESEKCFGCKLNSSCMTEGTTQLILIYVPQVLGKESVMYTDKRPRSSAKVKSTR